jgi:Concanavalin A-like lectin/glucanases superfamily
MNIHSFTDKQISGFLEQTEVDVPIKQRCRVVGFVGASICKWGFRFGSLPRVQGFVCEMRLSLISALLLTGCNVVDNSVPSPPQSSLVAMWRFDEGRGNVVGDASGNGNVATIRGGGWGEGHSGEALQMDGGNTGIVTVPLSDSLRSTADAITITAWTYRKAQHNVAVVSHGYPALFFGFHGPGFKWAFKHANGRVTECYANVKRYPAVLARWIHLAATYDGRSARLFADGVEICSKWGWGAGAIAMPDTPFTMSGYLTESGQIVDEITGRIDDVHIYRRALSESEIREVAGLGKALSN